MLIKRGLGKIVGVIEEKEHALDDEGTRKQMEKAAEEELKVSDSKDSEKDQQKTLVN